MLDLHTHILPHMDDGYTSVQESLSALEVMHNYGCEAVAATSHFSFLKDDVDSFLEKRETSFSRLNEAIVKNNVSAPKIIPGAEVLFFKGMSRYEGLYKLCYNNTKHILVELPYEKWDSGVFRELLNLNAEHGLVPVIAHIERYIDNRNAFDIISKYPFYIQINAEALTRFGKTKWLKRMCKHERVVLGSDTHDMNKRAPNMDKAFFEIERHIGQDFVEHINRLSRQILGIS